jgi:hypothetical protein
MTSAVRHALGVDHCGRASCGRQIEARLASVTPGLDRPSRHLRKVHRAILCHAQLDYTGMEVTRAKLLTVTT